ncbi:protein kinase domain-containing protein [Actinoplanes sp. CA-015351]|uniref:protein kinase domain-containing protein n=1 Tax=Actinoplanes sp. CA-015351 TaxID=3239897 RepID=UPI003D95385B
MDGLVAEPGTTVTGDPVVRLSSSSVQSYETLRTEVEIGIQLVQTFPSFPPQLSRLVGYDVPGRPTLAVVTRTGEQLSDERVRAMSTAGIRAAAESLLDALGYLAEAHIAHRDVTPHRLYWDGTHLQLTGFGQAVRVLPPVRREGGPQSPPWTAPEQLRGEGVVDTADDLYAAGAILFWMFTGEQPGEAAAMATRLDLQSDNLREQLDGMFAEPAVHRPSLTEVRRRWRPPVPAGPRAPAFEERAREADRAFAELRRRQLEDAPLGVVAAPMFLDRAAPPWAGARELMAAGGRWPLAVGAVLVSLVLTAIIFLVRG